MPRNSNSQDSQSNQEITQDPSSAYFLSSSYLSTIKLVPNVFSGNAFSYWKKINI